MSNEKIKSLIRESITTQALLLYDETLISKINEASRLIIASLKKGGKALIFGNGGSAADSQHLAAELVGRFQKERKGLAAVALTTDTSVLTALANDYTFDLVYKRQIEALAQPNDVVIAISTSGKSKNVNAAVRAAKKLRIKTIALIGKDGGDLKKIADTSLVVPSQVTARIQEAHSLIIHILCELTEEAFRR
jgi:D-sedoheptulose 7-phosphate isomerase